MSPAKMSAPLPAASAASTAQAAPAPPHAASSPTTATHPGSPCLAHPKTRRPQSLASPTLAALQFPGLHPTHPPARSQLRSHRYSHACRKPPPHASPHQSPALNKPSPPLHHLDAPQLKECPPCTAHLAPEAPPPVPSRSPLPPHPARLSAPHPSVRHKQPRRPRSPPSHRNVPSRSAEVSSLSPEPTSNKLLTPQHHNRRSPKVYRASTQNPQHPAQHRTAVTPNETSKTLFLRLPKMSSP